MSKPYVVYEQYEIVDYIVTELLMRYINV